MSTVTKTIIPSMLGSGTILKIGVRFHRLAVGKAIRLIIDDLADKLSLDAIISPYMRVDLLKTKWLERFSIPIPVDLVFNFLGRKSSIAGSMNGEFKNSAEYRVTSAQHLGNITYFEAILDIAWALLIAFMMGKISIKSLGRLLGAFKRKDLTNKKLLKKLSSEMEKQKNEILDGLAHTSTKLLKEMNSNFGDLDARLDDGFSELIENGVQLNERLDVMFSDTQTIINEQTDMISQGFDSLEGGLNEIDDQLEDIGSSIDEGFDEMSEKLNRMTNNIKTTLSRSIKTVQKSMARALKQSQDDIVDANYIESFRSVDRDLKATSEMMLHMESLLSSKYLRL